MSTWKIIILLLFLWQICSLLRGGIAERGGVRVGHRIIEINNQSVVAVPHDTIVKLLSSSVGEVNILYTVLKLLGVYKISCRIIWKSGNVI